MALELVLVGLVILLVMAVLYLIIRMRDVCANVTRFNDKFPFTEEVRRQVSDSIENLNERVISLGNKADRIGDVMNEVTALRNLFLVPKGAGGSGERLLEKALSDTLPTEMYETQHGLSSGVVS